MALFLKKTCGMANSVHPDQTALLIWVCTVCICHSVYEIIGHLPYPKYFSSFFIEKCVLWVLILSTWPGYFYEVPTTYVFVKEKVC